jgi:hypothetical protein
MVLACTEAAACIGPIDVTSIFYDNVPEGADASAIVRVTIIDLPAPTDNQYFVGLGKVEKVIKGEIDTTTIRVLSSIGDCLNKFPVGSRGIVIGDIRRDSQGDIELLAIAEPFYLRKNKRALDVRR